LQRVLISQRDGSGRPQRLSLHELVSAWADWLTDMEAWLDEVLPREAVRSGWSADDADADGDEAEDDTQRPYRIVMQTEDGGVIAENATAQGWFASSEKPRSRRDATVSSRMAHSQR
jgi:hypothetical protein